MTVHPLTRVIVTAPTGRGEPFNPAFTSSLADSMLPARFRRVSFDAYSPVTASQSEALLAVQAWLASVDSGPMLALVGKQGTGKSHLLYAAARRLIEETERMDAKERAQKRAQYPMVAPWYRLSDELRYGKSVETEAGGRTVDSHEVRRNLWGRRIVMLDEIRPTSGTGFDDTELAKFACHAYDDRIAVLITTNYHPLAAVMGDAAASRFTQIVIDGPDARQAA